MFTLKKNVIILNAKKYFPKKKQQFFDLFIKNFIFVVTLLDERSFRDTYFNYICIQFYKNTFFDCIPTIRRTSKVSGVLIYMGNSLILHTDKKYSEDEQDKFIENAYKAYIKPEKKQSTKTHKKPHGGFEIDIKFLTGKNLEYKKSFALMLIVKKHFTNSMVYNYSTESLSEKTGISKYIIETYIKRLISFEFCHFQGNHLQFVSLNKIMPLRSRGEVIYISEKSTINEIVEQLNILILKNNFSNQDKLRKIKSDLVKAKTRNAKINLKSYKKSLKIAEANQKIKDEKLIDFNVIGLRKLSQIIGSSLDYAARFIKKLLRKKLITIERIVKKYSNFEFNQFSSDELKDFINKKSGYFYSFNGCTYHHLGTEIRFIAL